jgi:hypothetical protein
MDDSAATTWLAIIAVASALQTLIILGVAFVSYRLYRRVTDEMSRLDRDYVRPVVERVDAVLDDARDVASRLRKVDDQIRTGFERVTTHAVGAMRLWRGHLWPVVGLGRGVATALASFARRQDATRFLSPGQRHAEPSLKGVPHVRN